MKLGWQFEGTCSLPEHHDAEADHHEFEGTCTPRKEADHQPGQQAAGKANDRPHCERRLRPCENEGDDDEGCSRSHAHETWIGKAIARHMLRQGAGQSQHGATQHG